MAQQKYRRGGIITGINVTPLVDVVLVLLVVLMVTSAYIASHTIPLDLPSGKTAESQTTTLAVSLDAGGALYLDGQRVDDAELRARARQARTAQADARAVIAADGSVPHRQVVHLIDLLREEGVIRYAIQVQPEDVQL